jgi:hypothetical protein
MNGPLVEEVPLWYSELHVEILVSYVCNVFGLRCIPILRVYIDVQGSAIFRVPVMWVTELVFKIHSSIMSLSADRLSY